MDSHIKNMGALLLASMDSHGRTIESPKSTKSPSSKSPSSSPFKSPSSKYPSAKGKLTGGSMEEKGQTIFEEEEEGGGNIEEEDSALDRYVHRQGGREGGRETTCTY